MKVLQRIGWGRSTVLAVLTLFLTTLSFEGGATHLRAGQITVRRVSCTGFVFEITVRVYTDTGSPVRFGGEQDVLDFGDGTSMLVPETENTPLPDLGSEIATASFTVVHTFPGNGRYIISYLEPNRNEGVLNMDNSVNTTFYLETEIIIDPFLGCNNTPQLLIAPIDEGCTGQAFFHNPGAFDPDGDSLSYEMVIPFRDRNTTVTNYLPPNSPKFYTNCSPGNEEGDGPPTFSINPIDGTVLWDAPCAVGEYNIAFIVVEWRKRNGVWYKVGFVRRDMQIIIEDCDNNRPDLIVPDDLCVEAGTVINEVILGIDPDNNQVKIEAFSEILNPPFVSPATVSPDPAVFQPSSPQPAELAFQWNTTCSHVKEQSYQIVFKITDNGSPRLVTFKTWRITVVAPAPQITGITPDFANRHANLTVAPYPCGNASSIQIWRRVETVNFIPDQCQTGMPENLGYQLINEVPISTTTYKDTNGGRGLAVGAKYCYRLVAEFPLPGGGVSYVSNEICIPPILADAPVLTHVTVDKTGITDGEIRVSWRSPFEIDQGQFPGPYEYRIFRANGFTGSSGITAIHPGNLPGDTTIVDDGINSEDGVLNYRNVLYSNTVLTPGVWSPIDTSLTASMVRLELSPQSKRIGLAWSADVPWSNQIQSHPRHLIFRGPEDADESDMVLIDSVNVFQEGFVYLDTGKYQNTPLDDNTVYCYRVMTRGGYGNPAIDEPLENYSQIICAQPKDDVAPCKPDIQAFTSRCRDDQGNDIFVQEYGCNPNSFVVELKWFRPSDSECRNDVRGYNIYAANTADGQFIRIATNIRDTVFYDSALSSFARCYRVSAVDRSGNESDLSDIACSDNCPEYVLPNYFSPNGDECNERFKPYGSPETFNEFGIGPCGLTLAEYQNDERCVRFVTQVKFTVYNRWGDEVYNYSGKQGEENGIYINWDGRNNNGTPLASGIYFYAAEVTQDVSNPAERVRLVKGWVHLVR